MAFTAQHKYHTLDQYLKDTYNSKVFKVALNGDFDCPNRDGKISRNGCFFCSEKGSGDFAGDKEDTLETQFNTIRNIIHLKWKDGKYIVYFQANTNTYGSLNKIKNLMEKAIKLDSNIVALSIATRCDSISDEVLDYLGELNTRIPVWVELGLQSIHEETLKSMNIGYTVSQFDEAVRRLREKNITVIAHIINGFPNETKDMMIETVKHLNTLEIQGIKIHSLFVLKNTILGNIYQKNPFKILELDEYVDIVCEQIAILRDDIIIHRVNGDAPKNDLLAPMWSLKKLVVMNEIDKEMKKRNYYQGCKYNKSASI